ncbi:MAG: ABC transporter ATP-binding protein [Candidatus Limiplasma sp.]|jgi:iron(III) transport system ATP-binding protein|nr:ABC transporter ATP-binding protein [Clostridiales bacterium]MDY3243224.1 ABC transporter ATP-binding protein [Candidatus Limiplasma sp.]
MGVAIQIDNVTKAYGKNIVIQGLSAEIQPGEFFTLLGPSGCGKTTLLRMIIGFNSIEGGEIRVDGKVINQIPTNRRNMGMVFQNYAVFPHMSVRDNVAYGLKTRHVPKAERYKRADEILKLVKIDDYADRMPTQLSGGQQQRVALARAIVIQPEVLLMDEPLSNLDAKLRVEMRNVIKRIQRQVGITTVYVTHDQEEALAISDRIAVMHGGVIQQIGTPKHIYQRPANEFVSSFIGLSNFVDAENQNGTLDFGCGYRVQMSTLRPDAGRKVCVAVRPEEFLIRSAEEPGIPATVRSSVFLGMTQHYFLTLGDEKEIEVVVPSDRSDLIPDGEKVSLQIVADKVNVFDGESRATVIREGV